ncbi:hypothetical protein M378DRAFT_565297 [Amanita muscaria Koide BX008]|uniref:Uncharacterized protein n=1 Tax=Amanita muscaria (strain Koide BX008) TaxID=946122 RepID=A0A0C2SNN3_AMAMK|nr:hypothetical protein M378DRAFT_565297 [Amanita muscaria Koide BX008]
MMPAPLLPRSRYPRQTTIGSTLVFVENGAHITTLMSDALVDRQNFRRTEKLLCSVVTVLSLYSRHGEWRVVTVVLIVEGEIF